MENMKIAAYLEDAGEDPVTSCRTLRQVGISHAVIRHVWTSNIQSISDNGCSKLHRILEEHNIKPVAIYSTLADVPANKLADISDEAVSRVFNLASYFGASMIGITCGQNTEGQVGDQIVDWLGRIQERALAANILPVVEITTKSHLFAAAEIAAIFSRFSRVKLLYDPVQLIIRQNIDPFVKYWALLKQFVAAIDVRDYEIGRGYKPFGFGDAQIARTVADAIRSDYSGWFYFEPSLGRRHGTLMTKNEVFKSAFETFRKVLEGWK